MLGSGEIEDLLESPLEIMEQSGRLQDTGLSKSASDCSERVNAFMFVSLAIVQAFFFMLRRC